MSGIELFTIGGTPGLIGPAAYAAGVMPVAGTAGVPVTLGNVLAVGGFFDSAASTIYQGTVQQQQAEYNAQQFRFQAERQRREAKLEAEDYERQRHGRLAGLRARLAGSGMAFEGTPLLVEEVTADDIERGVDEIREGGAWRSASLEGQAQLSLVRGREAKRQAYFSAGATLLRDLRGFSEGKGRSRW